MNDFHSGKCYPFSPFSTICNRNRRFYQNPENKQYISLFSFSRTSYISAQSQNEEAIHMLKLINYRIRLASQQGRGPVSSNRVDTLTN